MKKVKRERGWRKKTFKQAMAKELREHKSSFIVFYILRALVIVTLVRQIFLHNYEGAFFCVLTIALLYVPSWVQVRLRIEALENGGEVVGNRTRAKVVKNKVAPPFREAEFDIMYGEGIAHTGELIDLGVRLGIITKAGSWFSMGETRIGQGRDAAKKYLEENPDIAADVEAQIRANFDKLMGNQSRIAAAKAAGKAVNVSADDFDDEN